MAERKAVEWSATFQRLRAETVLTAFLLCVIAHPRAKLDKVPFTGISFENDVPRGLLFTILSLVFLYFLGAWWIRFKADVKDQQLDKDAIDSFLESIADLPEIIVNWNNKDNTALVGPLNSTIDRLQRDIDFIPKQQEISRALRELEPDPEMVDPYHSRHSVTAIRDLGGLLSNIENNVGVLTGEVGKLRASVGEYKSEIARAVAVAPVLIRNLDERLEKIQKELHSFKTYRGLDRMLAGFYLPFGISILLAVIAMLIFSKCIIVT